MRKVLQGCCNYMYRNVSTLLLWVKKMQKNLTYTTHEPFYQFIIDLIRRNCLIKYVVSSPHTLHYHCHQPSPPLPLASTTSIINSPDHHHRHRPATTTIKQNLKLKLNPNLKFAFRLRIDCLINKFFDCQCSNKMSLSQGFSANNQSNNLICNHIYKP